MRKGIALVCTGFILLSSGYAQKRVGVFFTPQYNFCKADMFESKSEKGTGFTFSGGAYFEMFNGGIAGAVGLGYTQLSNTLYGETRKKDYVSVPLTGTYEWDITEKFLLGTHAHFGVHYLLSEKLAGVKVEPVKKFNTSYGAGLSLTYLFTDEISISLQPGFTAMVVFDPDTPIYWNFGAQIRISYAFGY